MVDIKVGDKVRYKSGLYPMSGVVVSLCHSGKLVWVGKSLYAYGGPYACVYVGDLQAA